MGGGGTKFFARKGGGGGGGGGYKFLGERGGGGVNLKRGVATFLLLYNSITLTVCVRFSLLLFGSSVF